jgi:large subunit ribosomal protein L11
MEKGMIIPVVLTVYADKTYTFELKTPPAAVLIRKAAGIEKVAGNPLRDKVGKLTKAQLKDIATVKMPDINANDIDAAMNIVAGTARSMGVEVVD